MNPLSKTQKPSRIETALFDQVPNHLIEGRDPYILIVLI